MLPNPDLVEDGGDPSGDNHVADDVDAVPVNHQIEPVRTVGNSLQEKEEEKNGIFSTLKITKPSTSFC